MSLSKNTFSTDQSSKTKSAKWLALLSIISLLIIPFTILGYRFGLYQFSVVLQLFGVSLLVAGMTFLSTLFISLKQRNRNYSNSKQFQFSMVVSLLPLLFLGSQILTAKSVPMIHNISTDITDPPTFNEIVLLRGSSSNPYVYNTNEIGEIQKLAYPNIKTLTVSETVDDAFKKALLLVDELGWDLVSSDQQSGIIEASQTTKLWAFTDDVVIRIVAKSDKTEIDLRSVSRVGRSDLGVNAKRIQHFLDAYSK